MCILPVSLGWPRHWSRQRERQWGVLRPFRENSMTQPTDHKARMQRLKASVDRRIAEAQEEKGLLIVYTGAGKGKTTAALGMALRCLGHGMKIAIIQFIKGAIDTE